MCSLYYLQGLCRAREIVWTRANAVLGSWIYDGLGSVFMLSGGSASLVLGHQDVIVAKLTDYFLVILCLVVEYDHHLPTFLRPFDNGFMVYFVFTSCPREHSYLQL